MIRGIIVFVAVFVFASTAFAQAVSVVIEPDAETTDEEAPPEQQAPVAPIAAPQVTNTPETFQGKIVRGHHYYAEKNYLDALGAYQSAKEMDSGNALVYYFIACAQIKLVRYDDARVTLRTVSTLAGSKDPSLGAKALFLSAVLEEKRKSFDAAKEDWTTYQGYAETNTQVVTYLETANARLEVIENKIKLEDEYAVVRERIAANR